MSCFDINLFFFKQETKYFYCKLSSGWYFENLKNVFDDVILLCWIILVRFLLKTITFWWIYFINYKCLTTIAPISSQFITMCLY